MPLYPSIRPQAKRATGLIVVLCGLVGCGEAPVSPPASGGKGSNELTVNTDPSGVAPVMSSLLDSDQPSTALIPHADVGLLREVIDLLRLKLTQLRDDAWMERGDDWKFFAGAAACSNEGARQSSAVSVGVYVLDAGELDLSGLELGPASGEYRPVRFDASVVQQALSVAGAATHENVTLRAGESAVRTDGWQRARMHEVALVEGSISKRCSYLFDGVRVELAASAPDGESQDWVLTVAANSTALTEDWRVDETFPGLMAQSSSTTRSKHERGENRLSLSRETYLLDWDGSGIRRPTRT